MSRPTRTEFRDFTSESGRNEIHAWYLDLPKKAQAKMTSILQHLENEQNWIGSGFVKTLHGPGAGLLELVFTYGNVQYRPLMCHGPRRAQVTLLIGATERGGELAPPNVIDTAQRRKKLIERTPTRTVEHDYS